MVQFMANKWGMPYQLYIISLKGFNEVVEQYKNLTGEATAVLSELDAGDMVLEQSDSTLVDAVQAGTKGGESQIVEDAPVTKIVAVILRHAVEGNASDVHIERMREEIRVRFNLRHPLALRLRQRPELSAAEEGGVALDGRERGPQLMRDGGDEIALGFVQADELRIRLFDFPGPLLHFPFESLLGGPRLFIQRGILHRDRELIREDGDELFIDGLF